MPLRARLRGDDIVKFNAELRSTASAWLFGDRRCAERVISVPAQSWGQLIPRIALGLVRPLYPANVEKATRPLHPEGLT